MYYSQKSYSQKLGTSADTIAKSGCFLVSLANLVDRDPLELNKLFIERGGYVNGCLINSEKCAELLGINYYGKSNLAPTYTCIAETDHYKPKGVPQHFFLWSGGKIIDPLDTNPDWKTNPYNIVSYRLFNKKTTPSIVENLTQAEEKPKEHIIPQPEPENPPQPQISPNKPININPLINFLIKTYEKAKELFNK